MEQLKEYVKARKATEVAEAIGISRVYLWQLTHGRRKPSPDVMAKIANATNGAVPVTAWFE